MFLKPIRDRQAGNNRHVVSLFHGLNAVERIPRLPDESSPPRLPDEYSGETWQAVSSLNYPQTAPKHFTMITLKVKPTGESDQHA